MQYEVDYIPVGDGERGGDAITLRFGNLSGKRNEQKIIVIDGGTKESGKKLVEHIKNYYNTDYVDSVVCTHLHSDHSSGLTEVLNELEVGELIMHLPWTHSEEIKGMFKNKNISTKGLTEKIEKSLQNISELEEIAENNGITIIEPFEGLKIQDNITVLSPNKDYYKELLVNFTQTPEPKKEHSIADEIFKTGKSIVKWLSETIEFFTETLDDSGETTPENNSSTLLLLEIDDKKLLFTGDAGIPAFNKAIEYANSINLDLSNIHFLDIPHHGSKKNIGTTLLNHLKPEVAVISAPKEGDPKHPSRKVINALKRRGSRTLTTKGKTILHHDGSSYRENWVTAEEEPFFNEVED